MTSATTLGDLMKLRHRTDLAGLLEPYRVTRRPTQPVSRRIRALRWLALGRKARGTR